MNRPLFQMFGFDEKLKKIQKLQNLKRECRKLIIYVQFFLII